MAALAEAVDQRFGRVADLVDNAGVYPMQPFLEMTYERWREMLAINTGLAAFSRRRS